MQVHGIAKSSHRPRSDLEQLFRPSQIPQRSEISKRECKAILVLIPHRAQGKAAKFHAHSAAIPVIRGLHRSVLQKPQFCIETNIGRSTETLFAGVTVAQQKPELVEKLWRESDTRTDSLTRNLQIGIAA